MSDNAPLFGSGVDASQNLALEEARQRGGSAAVLKLIGELDYLAYIEARVQTPLDDKQLTLPQRLWFIARGGTFGSLVLVAIIVLRIITATAAHWIGTERSNALLFIITGLLIFYAGEYLTSRISYPAGLLTTAVTLTLNGFVGAIFIGEAAKAAAFIAVEMFRTEIITWCWQFEWLQVPCAAFFTYFLGAEAVEYFMMVVTIIALAGCQFSFVVRKKSIHNSNGAGRPYDLSTC